MNLRYPLAGFADRFFESEVRTNYFKGIRFDEPAGDPGWFGPDSATWYVMSNFNTVALGLLAAGAIESTHPVTDTAGVDHSRLWLRDRDGKNIGQLNVEGAKVRFGHSMAFFMGTAFGPTGVAERVSKIVAGMHHKLKGTRPDGLPYDADDPHTLRWNYATVVWGLATAHEKYHHKPLHGAGIERFYREFTRVGEAIGGTDLPATKRDVMNYLELDRHLVREPRYYSAISAARLQGVENDPVQRRLADLMEWAAAEMQPAWVQAVVDFDRGNPLLAEARIRTLRAIYRVAWELAGPIPELAIARRRVAAHGAPEWAVTRRS